MYVQCQLETATPAAVAIIAALDDANVAGTNLLGFWRSNAIISAAGDIVVAYCSDVDSGEYTQELGTNLAAGGAVNKFAVAAIDNSFNAALNGVAGSDDTSGNYAGENFTRFSIGSTNADRFATGLFKQVVVIPRRLTNAQLATLTT